MHQTPITIEEWSENHPRWPELITFVATQDQTNWINFGADFHLSSHLLVARQGDDIAGFLRFVIQQIGPDMDCLPVTLNGIPLTEAKVLAFGVDQRFRRQGLGRALQAELLCQARARGCYQVRSHSSGWNEANHQLKLAMGFGIHPTIRGEDNKAAYFIMPLNAADLNGEEK